MGFSTGNAPTTDGLARDWTITPDGSRLVYVGNNGTQLFVRALDTLEPVAVFTAAAASLHMPFVSPDGHWIGFVDTNDLKKIAMTGGPAVTLARVDGAPRGATWAPNDSIIFATNNLTTGIQRVDAAGGPTTIVTRPDRARGESDHVWPEILPGGQAMLFSIMASTGGPDAAQVAVLDLKTGTHRVLVGGGSDARYVASGHLIYQMAGTLWGVSFDLTRLETRGTPVPIIPDLMKTPTGSMQAAATGDGTLVYFSGSVPGSQRTLAWVDRHGAETLIMAPLRAYLYPRLSSSGTRIAVLALDQENDIWIWDAGPGTLARATFDPSTDLLPVWSVDGHRLMFTSERTG